MNGSSESEPNSSPIVPAADVVEEVDADQLDARRPSSGEAKSVKVKAEPYDSRPYEDKARRYIAYLLIWLLIAICLTSFALVMMWPQKLADVLQLIQIILSPVVALVSAATGFYYGTKTK